VRILSARYDAHPLGGMFLMGIDWTNHCYNTLAYRGYCQENYRGQYKVHFYTAKHYETFAHIQNGIFSFNIGCSGVGTLSKIPVLNCNIPGFIGMAWGVRRRVFVDITPQVTLSNMIGMRSSPRSPTPFPPQTLRLF
jgi:hypothetical protein